MLVFDNVTKQYHYEQTPTIANFSLQLTDRLNTVLIDAQSGKTTLCKLILGLEKPTAGKVTFDGKDCSQIDGKQLDATYLCKDLLLFGGKTALYNVAYPLILRGHSKQSANEIARQALQNMGIEPTVKVKKLSPTQQVDVVLARLFVRNSTLVVIDDFLPLLTDSQRQSLMQFVEQSNSFVVHFTSNVDLSFGATYLWYEDQIFTQNIKEKMQNIFWLNNF